MQNQNNKEFRPADIFKQQNKSLCGNNIEDEFSGLLIDLSLLKSVKSDDGEADIKYSVESSEREDHDCYHSPGIPP